MAYIPYMIVVEDFYRIVPKQAVKYMIDEENIKDGKVYHNMKLTEDVRDIRICPFDGMALASPSLCDYVSAQLGETITSFIFRLPYGKGLASKFDFARYCRERHIYEIADVWGERHDIDEIELILTRSTWKGEKYFTKFGDSRDWNDYLTQCEKYDYTLGISKWQKSLEEEPVYTRANYQILQDLKLSKEDFLSIADYSKAWGEQIAHGFGEAVWNFAGLTYKVSKDGKVLSPQTDDPYFKAMLKNPVVLGDKHIRKHIQSLADKFFTEFCCGKLWVKGAFKFIVPDPIALMQHITGQEVTGSLAAGEMFSQSLADGIFEGKCILERNPHIARSEHCVLNAIGKKSAELMSYCGHLSNTVIINTFDATLPRLSGADADGDIVFVLRATDNPAIYKGINQDLPIVINIDEKATAKAERIGNKALINDFVFGSDNRIGEYSNCATKWYNKMPPKYHADGKAYTDAEKDAFYKRNEDYVNLIAIINAKEIDSAKTHIKVNLPRHIQKMAGDYPYFMMYAGEYYANHSKFNKAPSNMNSLCYEMEDWKKRLQWKKANKDFDWHIYLNTEIKRDEGKMHALERVYMEYAAMRRDIKRRRLNSLANFKEFWRERNKKEGRDENKIPMHLFAFDASSEYNTIDDIIRQKAEEAVPIASERANYAVEICYSRKTSSKSFAWLVAGDAIARNIKQVTHKIPLEVEGGEYDFMYLGRKYLWASYPNAITPKDGEWWRNLYTLQTSEDGESIVFVCIHCGMVVKSVPFDGRDIEVTLPHKCPHCAKGIE